MLSIFGKKPIAAKSLAEALELNFDLPSLRQQESKLPDPGPLWTQLDALAAEPVYLLVELNQFLHELNRTHLPGPKRFSLTLRAFDCAAPVIRRLYFEHQKGKALPEMHGKREALTVALKCVKELYISYKRIIKSDYKPTGNNIKTPGRRARQCMVSVLELIHTEQRLKALRYQRLGNQAWRDCNLLYYILHSTGDVNKLFKTSGLSVGRGSPNDSMAKQQKTSTQEIFVAIQLLGLIDPNTLSLQQGVMVENYLKQFAWRLKITAYTPERLPLDIVLTDYTQEGPPRLQIDSLDVAHALVIDVKPLLAAVRQEYEGLLAQLHGPESDDSDHSKESALSRSGVNRNEDIELLLALQAMEKKFREAERVDTRKYSDETQEVYVYNGFTAVYRMLSANKSQIDGYSQLENQLNINLAKRSAAIAENSDGENYTQWEIVNESTSGVLLRTRETQFIKNLFVGQLMAFGRTKADLTHPFCGWVVRICRDNTHNLEISLKILASHVESVVVQTDILQKNAMGMPGIMVFDAGEDLQLIMHQSHRLSRGVRVAIHRHGNPYEAIVGDVGFFQREFVVYCLKKSQPVN